MSAETSAQPVQPKPERRRRRKWPYIAVAVAGVVILLVALAPSIISAGVGQGSIMAYAGDQIGGRMQVRDLSLSWFGSQSVQDLEVSNPEGAQVARLGKASIDQGLWSLAWGAKHLGAVTVEDASVDLAAAEKLTPPAREAAATKPAAGSEAGPPMLPVRVEIKGVRIKAQGADLTIPTADFRSDQAGPSTFNARLEFSSDGRKAAAVVDGSVTGLTEDWKGADAVGLELHAKTENQVPLAIVWGIARAMGARLDGGGSIAGAADVVRNRAGRMTVQSQWQGRDVWVSGEALKGDRLELATVGLTTDLAVADQRLTVNTLSLDSPVATASASGTFYLSAPAEAAPAETGRARFDVQLAPLARMLPNTLGLQKGVEVTGGRLSGQADMRRSEGTSALHAVADVQDVRGTRDGRAIALEPLHVETDVASSADQLRIEQLIATAAFGRIEGSGTIADFSLTADLKLGPATDQVGQFVDLGGVAASGDLTATVQTRGTPGEQIDADLDAQVANLTVDLGDGRRWVEPKASLTATASVAYGPDGAPRKVTVKPLKVTAAGGALAGSTSFTRQDDSWQMATDLKGSGDLAPLADRLAGLRGEPAPGVTGGWTLELVAEGKPGASMQAVVSGGATDLVYTPTPAAGAPAGEPRRVGDVNFAVDLDTAASDTARTMNFRSLNVTGAGMNVDASGKVTVPAAEGTSPEATGKAKADLALDRMEPLLKAFSVLAPDDRLAGSAAFNADVRTQGGRIDAQGVLQGNGVQVDLASADLHVAEPQPRVPFTVTYEPAGGRTTVVLENLQTRVAQGNVRAAFARPDGKATDLDASLDLAVDGDAANGLLPADVKQKFTLGGAWNIKADARGPLHLDAEAPAAKFRDLVSSGTIDVGTFTAQGAEGTGGRIAWQMNEGRANLAPEGPDSPSRLDVADGQVLIPGEVDLTGDEPRFVLDREATVVDKIAISDKLCKDCLMYLSPLVGHTVSSKGRLTITLAKVDMPLGPAARERGTVEGQMTIDDYTTTLQEPFALLAKWMGTPAEVKQETFGPVPIDVRDGLFHLKDQKLYLQKEVALSLDGTIGFGGAMDILVGMPLTTSLLEKFGVKAPGGVFLDKIIRVPLEGTLQQPRIDEKELAKQVVMAVPNLFLKGGQQIGDLIGDLIGKEKPPAEQPAPEQPAPEQATPEQPAPEAAPEQQPANPLKDIMDIFKKNRDKPSEQPGG